MERQWIFKFLYFTAQGKTPDVQCLLMSEGQSRIPGMQTSPEVGVYFSRWSQSQNNNEPRGAGENRVNWQQRLGFHFNKLKWVKRHKMKGVEYAVRTFCILSHLTVVCTLDQSLHMPPSIMVCACNAAGREVRVQIPVWPLSSSDLTSVNFSFSTCKMGIIRLPISLGYC